VLPAFFQYVANGFEWDEDKQLIAMITGPLNGFFILGDVVARSIASLFGERFFAGEPNFIAFAADIAKGVEKAIRSIDADIAEGEFSIDMQDMLAAMVDIAQGVGTATGLPVDAAEGIIEGTQDIVGGNVERGAYRFLGWPAGAVKNKGEPEVRSSGGSVVGKI